MKSLEYVKKIREDLNQCFRHWNPATMNNDNDFYHNEWEKIQQDLEVLEIIKESHLGNDDIFIRFLIASYMDIDKYNKVKQWLEDNEWKRKLMVIPIWLDTP